MSILCIIVSKDGTVLTAINFSQIQSIHCTQYIRKNILHRIFSVIDTKKDGIIDFEEFLCAVALFRAGSAEDKLKFLFLMYEPVKGGYLTRDQIRNAIVDCNLSCRKDALPSNIEDMLTDLRDLADGMVDAILYQFASQDGKVDFQEFLNFLQMEPNLQSFLKIIQSIIDM